jgi:hypothetical protein
MKKFLVSMVIAVFLFGMGGFASAATVAGDPLLNPVLIAEIESTDRSGADGTLITGTKGTSTYAAVWNADGDLVDGPGVPAVINLSNVAATAIGVSLISDTACTDDLGTEAIPWKTGYFTTTLSFEGATDNEFQTLFTITDPTTADRTITVPNSDQTIGVATSAAADAIDAIAEIAAALKSGADTTLITGTAGASGNVAAWNADGDIVDGGSASPGSFGAAGTPTIASGIAAAGTTNWLLIDGEGGVDDALTEITANALGDIIIVQAVDDATTITVTDGSYMQLCNDANFIMNNGADIMGLFVTTLGANDVCTELFRSNNGA